MPDLYYGNAAGRVVGPYHPDELGARSRAMRTLGQQVYEIKATSYEEARGRLLAHIVKEKEKQA